MEEGHISDSLSNIIVHLREFYTDVHAAKDQKRNGA